LNKERKWKSDLRAGKGVLSRRFQKRKGTARLQIWIPLGGADLKAKRNKSIVKQSGKRRNRDSGVVAWGKAERTKIKYKKSADRYGRREGGKRKC